MDYSQEQVNNIVAEAKQAAEQAARKFFQEKLGGKDQYSCGFAWVEIYGIKGNTKLGKAFKAAGINKNYNGAYSIWNPAGLGVQNIDTLEAGAEAAAKVFERYGFKAYAGSRLD
jgi:outer membrane cobalamin receptor